MATRAGFKPNTSTVDKLKKRADKLGEAFMVETIKRIKEKTPVRTGALQAGWHLVKTRKGFEIMNDEEYATYVEFGTEHTPPVAMVGRTFLEKDDITRKVLKETK